MNTFIYTAKNDDGILVSGDIQADRSDIAVTTLKNKGYYLISLEEEAKLSHFLRSGTGLFKPVSVKEKAIFTQQLATLLRAGMQLSLALKTLGDQTENAYLASVVRQLHSDIEESSSLSEAMRKHPRAFSAVYAAIVEAAEESGSLADTLSVLSKQLKTQSAVRARIRGAMVYPIFLLFSSAIVVGVLMTFVIPKFIELFVNTNQELPLPTKILQSTTVFVKSSWWLILIVLSGISGLTMIALRERRFRLSVHHIMLKLPLVGNLIRKIQLARFSRTLGSLLRGGVRIITAMKTTRGTTANLAFAQATSTIEDDLLKGSSLAESMANQGHFSILAANMVAVGEDTGMLPEMLLELADMYDQECESAIDSITTLLGPLMIVFLGGIVGFVVVAILLPIFRMNAMIG